MDRRNYDLVNRYAINPARLGLWHLDSYEKKMLNIASCILIMLVISYIVAVKIILGSDLGIFTMVSIYLTEVTTIIACRTWWLWNCNENDQFFIVNMKLKISTGLHLLCLVMITISTISMKIIGQERAGVVDFSFTYPMLAIIIILNCINFARVIRFYLTCYKQLRYEETQRQRDETVFNTVFRNREGYSEAREEMEQAGIDSNEIEMIQRQELRNARRLLRNFGNRALENINMLRMILNVDADRDQEDTETSRVILFTRIDSMVYDKLKHGHLDSCSICYSDFSDNDILKSLPKCNHTFHEDCIEKWIVKSRNRNVFCPVCRLNIKDELDAIDQLKAMEQQENSKESEEEEEEDSQEHIRDEGESKEELRKEGDQRSPEHLTSDPDDIEILK